MNETGDYLQSVGKGGGGWTADQIRIEHMHSIISDRLDDRHGHPVLFLLRGKAAFAAHHGNDDDVGIFGDNLFGVCRREKLLGADVHTATKDNKVMGKGSADRPSEGMAADLEKHLRPR